MSEIRTVESLIWEARARVSWGEAPGAIAVWMRESGIPKSMIDEVLQAALRERDLEIRQRGLAEVIIGGCIAIVGVGALVLIYMMGVRVKRLPSIIFAGTLYGLFRLLRGLTWLLRGKKLRGAITDLDGSGMRGGCD